MVIILIPVLGLAIVAAGQARRAITDGSCSALEDAVDDALAEEGAGADIIPFVVDLHVEECAKCRGLRARGLL